jgi:hypothetical protein
MSDARTSGLLAWNGNWFTDDFHLLSERCRCPQSVGIIQAPRTTKGPPQSWGSRGYSHWRVRIVGWLEALSEAGAESTIIDGASNLKQQIGTAS